MLLQHLFEEELANAFELMANTPLAVEEWPSARVAGSSVAPAKSFAPCLLHGRQRQGGRARANDLARGPGSGAKDLLIARAFRLRPTGGARAADHRGQRESGDGRLTHHRLSPAKPEAVQTVIGKETHAAHKNNNVYISQASDCRVREVTDEVPGITKFGATNKVAVGYRTY